MLRKLVITLTLIFFTMQSLAASQGKLVIAGGAISDKSKEIFAKFAELSGGAKAKIGVVPAATGSIGKQYQLLKTQFSEAGVSLSHIQLLPLATKDDSKTPTDEATWLDNGNTQTVADSMDELTGIWFIGGDQTLITKTLLNTDGSDTLVLKKIRQLYKTGATIGGTSAGAAIMSNIMIAGGNSQGALFQGFTTEYTSMDEQEYGPISTAKGLGFFEFGIVDQHFDRKGRLGRLIVTLLNESNHNIGYGVDEGTAMIVSDNTFSVIGEGGVTVVNSKHVEGYAPDTYPISVQNIRLAFVQPGDSYDLVQHQLTPRSAASSTVGHEYFNVPEQSISGLMNANRNIDQFIGYDLLDNKATNQVSSWLFDGKQAIQMIFSQDKDSQGYWNTDLTADVYSFDNVRMDIKPLQLKLSK